jgi:hypothetical protein
MSRVYFALSVFFMSGCILFSAFGVATLTVFMLVYALQWSGKLLLAAVLELD